MSKRFFNRTGLENDLTTKKFAAQSREETRGEKCQAMQLNKSNDEKQARKPRDAPYCWQHKGALRMITNAFSESDQAASARSVYVALTELASDNESEAFTASKALIAHKAAVSVKTVERMLKGLEQLGVVDIKRRKIEGAFNAPNTYTLLPLRHGDATLRLGRSPLKSDKVEEKEKNLEENVSNETNIFSAKRRPNTFSAKRRTGNYDLSQLCEDDREIVDAYNETLVPLGWVPVNRVTDELLRLLATFAAAATADWHELIRETAGAPNEWPKPRSRTIFRVGWDNY
jgi:hypothetical protein